MHLKSQQAHDVVREVAGSVTVAVSGVDDVELIGTLALKGG